MVSRLGEARALEELRSPADDPWSQVPGILARIKAPVFRSRDFVVTKFGAKGYGKVDCTEAIRRNWSAIATACCCPKPTTIRSADE